MEVTMSNSFLSQLSDQDLLYNFKSNPQQVISELINRYQSKIYTSIYLIVKDKYLAEDLYQDTFIKIYTTLQKGKYTDQGKFLPWALRIAHNLCIDHFRKLKQQVKITLQDGTDIFKLFISEEENIQDKQIRQQSDYILHQLIDALPLEQKEVIILRMYGDLAFKDIAKITGVSVNTALGRMRYALINLKREIINKKLPIR
jgi:RNA polymerase sigma factor (sigma-70 family)